MRDQSFQQFGERIFQGGELFEKEQNWFNVVDSRPEDYVLLWLETIKCPVIRVDGTLPVEENANYLLSILQTDSDICKKQSAERKEKDCEQ